MTSTIALASEGGAPKRLCAVVRDAPHLLRALNAARDVDAPDWLISAGAIRDAVWDALHDRPPTAMPRDIDLGFFDPSDLTGARRRRAELRRAAEVAQSDAQRRVERAGKALSTAERKRSRAAEALERAAEALREARDEAKAADTAHRRAQRELEALDDA